MAGSCKPQSPEAPLELTGKMPETIRRRTEITVEEHILVRRTGTSIQGHCENCGAGSWTTTVEDAAAIAGVSARVLYRWVEEGRIHFRETPEGALVICLGSVREQLASS